jgi:hypothetical protein
MAVSRALNSGLSGRTRKSAGIGTVESCGSASAASGHELPLPVLPDSGHLTANRRQEWAAPRRPFLDIGFNVGGYDSTDLALRVGMKHSG